MDLGFCSFGCRTFRRHFDDERFDPTLPRLLVSMIERYVSHVARPGPAVLPSVLVNHLIAAGSGVPVGGNCPLSRFFHLI